MSIIDSFDFISLVESWLSENTVNIQGFYSFSNCRQKSNRAGRNSGGITVLVKSELRKGVKFFDKESSEEFVWWKLEKEFFHLKQDLFVCSVYIPLHNSPREKRLDCDHFETLQETIYKFSKLGNIVLCGDFYARIGTLDDFVIDTGEILPNPVFTTSIEPRKSRDNHVNAYGRLLIELCCGNELIVLNGRTKGDLIGQFTCQTYNGASVVDYAIVSTGIMQFII